ncbi:hypothetical protein BDV96DRAFT_578235 [Lophiotrema nucula]|uniref:DUF7136 domain-containing protein n=1 Tax=Lophiotrema nucula TaxID=690887 RepID=A0A6A5Z5U2_9PLEO|nr:hypothetical protein BDV96DRAFT_578235 [Lophiotrema nucula]
MGNYALLAIAALGFRRTALAQSTTTADATVTSTATPTAASPNFEVDIVFPRANITYNFTDYIPIVFAFQNLSAAAALGPFTFLWDIMPYGIVGDLRPGGITEDLWSVKLSSENVSGFENPDGSPYILVNLTNTTKWVHLPNYGVETVYALQWYVQWDAFWDQCRRSRLFEKVLFNVRPDSLRVEAAPNPGDLRNVTGSCAQYGAMVEVVGNNTDSCSNIRDLTSTEANPCAIKLDASLVSSISSEAAILAGPTSTSSTSILPSSTNGCGATAMPVNPMLVTFGFFGGMQLLIF